MLAEGVWILTLLCLLFLTVVFVFVIINSSSYEEYSEVQKKWYAIRSKWFAFLAVLGVVVTGVTLVLFPINAQVAITPSEVVNVVGYQWYWKIDKTDYSTGDTIEFHVTSGDANHGFGIYNSDGELLTQTQAMPDYISKVAYTFNEPGLYSVLCLEYCGLAHHAMKAELTVK
jgi:cytochrome c oxidase subunit 2